MSQQSFHQQTATGADINFTIDTFESDEIKVYVDGVLKTAGNHYNINPYNTNSQSTVDWIGTAPSSPSIVRIVRETDVLNAGNTAVEGRAEYQAGASVKADDLNNNQKQVLRALQEHNDQLIQTYDVQDSAITTAKIKADNITSALIADDQIDSEHIVADSIDTEHYAPNSVDTTALAADAVTGAQIGDSQINSEHYVDGSIDREHLAPDIVDGSKIADDSINSEHYAADSIDTEHYAPGSVDTTALGADSVNGDKIANDSINSEHYVDASIDEQHIANSAVTSNKIADNAVGTTEISNGSVTTDKIANDAVTAAKLADNSVNHEQIAADAVRTSEIQNDAVTTAKIAADAITNAKIADNSIDSEHYVDGSIDTIHLAANCVTSGKIATNAVNTTDINDDAVTIDKIADAAIVTNSEQASHSVDDNTFFTTSASDARYFNISSGDTIKDGQSFPDNDTTIATTAAINDRIIDLVDDVGGFVPIANETSFPNANPDVNNGTGTIVSISTLASNHTSNGSGTFTISNGTVGNSTVTINGAANNTTYSAGYGLLVETTTTLNTYTFHRLVPKATEVTTVAGKATEIGRLGTADAVADMAILGTADVVADMNTLGTADVVSDMNALAVSDVISDMNTLAVTSVINDMDTVAGIQGNVTTVAGIHGNVTTVAGIQGNVTTVAGIHGNVTTVAGISGNVTTVANNNSNVTSVASNMANVNNFADRYQIASNNPSTDGGGNALAAGDLYFNTSANELKVYNGSSWQGGVTATGTFAATTGNTFTGDNRYNDGVKALFGTDSDFQIVHDGSNGSLVNSTGYIHMRASSHQIYIDGSVVNLRNHAGSETLIKGTGNGAAELYYDNVLRFQTTANGALVGASYTAHSLADDFIVSNSGDSCGITIAANSAGRSSINFADAESSNISFMEYNHSANRYRHYVNDTLAVQIDDDLQVRLGKGSFGGMTSGVIAYGNAGSIKKDSILALNATASVTGRGAGVSVGGNTERIASFYCQKAGNADSAGGNAFLESKGDLTINVQDSETGIDVNGNGAVDLYYDNSKKLETASDGILASGAIRTNAATSTAGSADQATLDYNSGNLRLLSWKGTGASSASIFTKPSGGSFTEWFRVEGDGGIKLPVDNQKLYFGTGHDLSIYHDGNHSFVSNSGGAGNLVLYGNGTNSIVAQAVAGENSFIGNSNGSVELFYDNSQKFVTTSTGGKFTSSRVQFHNSTSSGGYAQFSNAGTGHSSADGFWLGANSSNQGVVLNKENTDILFYTNNTETFRLRANGDAALTGDKGLYLGANDDLLVGHDGSLTRISDTFGHMKISSNTIEICNQSLGENYIKAVNNGAVELYYDNSKKFETTSTGGTLTGTLVANNLDVGNSVINRADITVVTDGSRNNGVFINPGDTGQGNRPNLVIKGAGDQGLSQEAIQVYYNNGSNKTFDLDYEGNIEARSLTTTGTISSGSGSDQLNITHSGGGASHVAATGDLVLKGTDNVYINGVNNETGFKFTENGSVSLYYDNVEKLRTTSGGIEPKGNVRHTDNIEATFGSSQDLKIVHDGSNSFISESGTGNLVISTTAGSIRTEKNTGEAMIHANVDGSVDLYYDNSKKFETTNTGVQINGGIGNGILLTGALGSAEHFKIANTTSGAYIQIGMQQQDTDGLHHRAYIRAQKGSGSIAGKLELLARGSGGGTDRGWIIDAGVGIQANTSVLPETTNTYNLGSTSKRWANIYTNDLHLSNEGHTNDVDGTWGNWTIQEGESDLFLKNNRSGKKYKFNLTEVS